MTAVACGATTATVYYIDTSSTCASTGWPQRMWATGYTEGTSAAVTSDTVTYGYNTSIITEVYWRDVARLYGPRIANIMWEGRAQNIPIRIADSLRDHVRRIASQLIDSFAAGTLELRLEERGQIARIASMGYEELQIRQPQDLNIQIQDHLTREWLLGHQMVNPEYIIPDAPPPEWDETNLIAEFGEEFVRQARRMLPNGTEEGIREVCRRHRISEEEREQARRRREEEAQQQKEAQERADALLQDFLNSRQKYELKTKGYFTVISKLGERYRIRRGHSMNITKVNRFGKHLGSFCATFPNLPDADVMVGQALMIQNHEEEFLRVANRFS